MEKRLDDMNKILLENTLSKEELIQIENVKKTYSEICKTRVERSEQKELLTHIQEYFESLQQEKEQEKRKCNLAVINLPESEMHRSDERLREDSDLFTYIIKQELSLHVKVEKAIRVGQRTADRPRVLIVTLKDEPTKWEVLKASKALKDSQNDMAREMYINKDMTQLERERNITLRDEVISHRARGEHVKIVKGKCVTIKKTLNRPDQAEKTLHDQHKLVPKLLLRDSVKKSQNKSHLEILYTNVDGFLNKKDELVLSVKNGTEPHVIVTEAIPKRQKSATTKGDLFIDGYQGPFTNFDLNNVPRKRKARYNSVRT